MLPLSVTPLPGQMMRAHAHLPGAAHEAALRARRHRQHGAARPAEVVAELVAHVDGQPRARALAACGGRQRVQAVARGGRRA